MTGLQSHHIVAILLAHLLSMAFGGCATVITVPVNERGRPPDKVVDWSKDAHLNSVIGSSLAASPRTMEVAIGCMDKMIRIMDMETWTIKNILKGHDHQVVGVAFSPDGSLLASIDEEGIDAPEDHLGPASVRLWNTHDWQQRQIVGSFREREILGEAVGGGSSVAFSSDGKFLFWTHPTSRWL